MTQRFGLPLVMLLALALLVPTTLTAAYLTAEQTAQQTVGGVGRWCSVPTPEKQSNVYRLSAMPYYTSSESRMAIVPVVNNGEYGPSGGERRLGVRLWACDGSRLSSGSQVKITAWRNTGSRVSNKVWLPRHGSGFAGHRLNPTQGFGAEIVRLHREGSTSLLNSSLVLSDRSKYSWLVASGRSKNLRDARPGCATVLCSITIDPVPTFTDAFNSDTGTSRTPSNSVEYLASGYWSGAGSFSSGTPNPVNLAAYSGPQAPFGNNQGPTSTDGRQIQWVIMESWGTTAPSEDMVVEVFLR